MDVGGRGSLSRYGEAVAAFKRAYRFPIIVFLTVPDARIYQQNGPEISRAVTLFDLL